MGYDVIHSLPTFHSPDYFIIPSLDDLATKEILEPGYSSRVPDVTVGKFGQGHVKFLGETDIRGLALDKIVKFRRHEVVVYDEEDEFFTKPAVGQGLNKAAEVTLPLQLASIPLQQMHVDCIVEKLKLSSSRQGATFLSFDPSTCEWKFLVEHFSKFGLSEDDEEDIMMEDAPIVQLPDGMNIRESSDTEEGYMSMDHDESLLSHSLPNHLGLDPAKMKEMRLLMFSAEEEAGDLLDGSPINSKYSSGEDYMRAYALEKTRYKTRLSPVVRRTPLPLLEYHPSSQDSTAETFILMSKESKSSPPKPSTTQGFRLDLTNETPVNGIHSQNVVDAALFLGRSFRVGWGPNGILVHCGLPVGSTNQHCMLSSVINLQKVAIDRVVRDDSDKVREDLIVSCFDTPLQLHKALDHETQDIEVGDFRLKLQKVVSTPIMLPEICQSYVEIIEKHLEISGLSSSAHRFSMHQVMVWELIKVLFSEIASDVEKRVEVDDEEDMMYVTKQSFSEADDVEALPFMRRAKFSFWLQESIQNQVENDISMLNGSKYLENIFLLLTGRQMDRAVEMAVSRGDVRLACLLSQAGGSVANRFNISEQISLWRKNGLDFGFIENDRLRLYELLAGNIQGALGEKVVDWKRFLGLLMWYQLSPETPLHVLFLTYRNLVDESNAPSPVPAYISEDPSHVSINGCRKERFDLTYYLMLLHANGKSDFSLLKAMFSAFASTNDPLDHHMIWHQRAVLEAIGSISSHDLHLLDMGLVSQLICLGQCHWAIYVVLHMPYISGYPNLHATLIREILFQYCESWKSQDSQRQFIEELGIPVEWMHEALAIYHNYYGHSSEALDNFLLCKNWQKAHMIFMTTIAHSLYLSGEHSKTWKLASIMENNKNEIENWELGAGIYVSFYHIKRSLQEASSMSELVSLDDNNIACMNFFNCMHDSLAVWGNRLPLDGRVAFLRMAEEICELFLLRSGKESTTSEALLTSYGIIRSAPIPEDNRSCHLQEAISHFTCHMSDILS